MRFLTAAFVLFLLSPAHAQQTGAQTFVRDIVSGEGDTAINGARVVVQYVGWLSDDSQFDSSYDRGQPFGFTLGAGEVIPGWEVGIKGMRVGGRRELIVPPSMAYGERGAGKAIPPSATLRFEIELISVEATAFGLIDAPALQAALPTLTVVDIRSDPSAKTIQGAIRLPAFDAAGKLNRHFLAALLKHANKATPIALIDDDGKKALFIGGFLAQNAGFEKLLGLKGGLKAWTKSGYTLID